MSEPDRMIEEDVVPVPSDEELDGQAAADIEAHMLIPADEIGRWIASWGTATPLPMPTPRKIG